MHQCIAEGSIDDGRLPPPQAQDLPHDATDFVDIHLLYDAARLDLLFKRIAQSIKFIGRFGDKQRQLRQKCQLVSSTHLLTPVNLPEAGELPLAKRTCCCTQRITRRVSADLRSESPRTQPSSSLNSTPRLWVNRDLPLPIPGEGRDPVAQSLPHWGLAHRLEGPNRLRCLAPQSRFVAAHAVKQSRVKVGKAQETLRDGAGFRQRSERREHAP